MIDKSEIAEETSANDYEAGFLDGWFYAKGIEDPTEEQLIEAFKSLDDFIETHPPKDEV